MEQYLVMYKHADNTMLSEKCYKQYDPIFVRGMCIFTYAYMYLENRGCVYLIVCT